MVNIDGDLAEFRFFRPQAQQVFIAGDFNDWREGELTMSPAGDGYWTVWGAMFRDPLVAAQVKAERDGKGRFVRGSWDPAKHTFSRGAGRVYATAMGVLCLETYYRYTRVYPHDIMPPAEF